MSNTFNITNSRGSVSIEFPQAYLPSLSLTNVVFHQKQRSHDVVVFSFSGYNNSTISQLIYGSPIKMLLKSNGVSDTFFGYVHHVSTSNNKTAHSMTVTCVGASYVLAEKNQKTWSNTTAANVVKDVCLNAGLNVDLEPTTREYQNISQNGLSSWQLLNKLADENGFVLKAVGTTIQFVSRNTAESFYRPLSQILTRTGKNYPNGSVSANMRVFRPKAGAYTPEMSGEASNKTIGYLDQNTGEIVTLTKSNDSLSNSNPNIIFNSYLSSTASSAGEAGALLDAEIEKSRFIYTADAEVTGITSLSPEKLVYVDDGGKEYSGYWTILEATHVFDFGTPFTTALILGTDSLGSAKNGVTESPNSSYFTVNHTAMSSISYPYADPVLEKYSVANGSSGVVLKDFRWTAAVRRHA